MKTDNVHIDFILDAIRKIEDFTFGMNEDAFNKDQLRQSGVILQLMIIGETVKSITEETKAKINIAWKEIAGFRDVAIHDYVNLKLNVVWDTIQKNIPELKKKLLTYKSRE